MNVDICKSVLMNELSNVDEIECLFDLLDDVDVLEFEFVDEDVMDCGRDEAVALWLRVKFNKSVSTGDLKSHTGDGVYNFSADDGDVYCFIIFIDDSCIVNVLDDLTRAFVGGFSF